MGQGAQGGCQLRPRVSPQLHPADGLGQLAEPVLHQDVPHLCSADHPGSEHPGPEPSSRDA